MSGIIAAVDWAVTNGLHVVSMSLGSRFPSSAMHEALIAAHNRGLVIVAASGNETVGPGFPAFYREVVSVGAVDKNKKPASFTNRDPGVDIAAPGVGVYSSVPGGKFASYSGTSMACPHVSGVFTAILGERKMENMEAENLIYETAEDVKRHSWEVGRGLVRIDNALKRL
jgi:subtilisin